MGNLIGGDVPVQSWHRQEFPSAIEGEVKPQPEPSLRSRRLPVLTPLRAERLRAGLALHELAAASGVPMSTLSKAERGEQSLSEVQERARSAAIARITGLDRV